MYHEKSMRVSRLCFGTLTLGPLQADLTVEEGGGLLAYAIARGVNFCDTAQLYKTYPYIREGMRRSGRYDLIISTKTYAYTRQLAVEAVEEARRALDRDYIDVFLLHEQESVYPLEGHKEALDYLYECKAKGVIRAVGLSTHAIAGVRGAVEKGLDLVFPMMNVDGLGLIDGSRPQMEAAARDAHDAGLGVFAMKALGGGNLHRRAPECFDYILGLPYVDSVAVGMQSTDEVDLNLSFFLGQRTDPALRDRVAAKPRRLLIEDWCERCGACVKRCGQGALSMGESRAVCDHSKCVLCGYCSTVCPQWCIKVV